VSSRDIVADRGDGGERVDRVIRRHLADLHRATRTRVQAWIASGRVAINGRVVTRVSTRVASGDVVRVRVPEEHTPAPLLPEDLPIDALFEDDHLLAVNKPAGIVSHPTFRHPFGSLLNGVLFHARTWPPDRRPSLVGRLDKLTSGLVVIAKSATVHATLQRTLAGRSSCKEYLAVVSGTLDRERGSIQLPLRRDSRDRRRVVAAPDGVPSLTRFERVAAVDLPPLALLRCELVTGRMHQIRVHLSANGWPIVGDRKYGGPLHPKLTGRSGLQEIVESFPRQALHAWRLTFTHPSSGERLTITAPLPQDMRDLVEACGWDHTPTVRA
jgi:23S rRNA pseudouridine1911/1915/1917 synthase